jgi:hypothetical protein
MRHAKFLKVLCLLLFAVFTVHLAIAPMASAADGIPSTMTPDQWKRFQKLEPSQKLEIRDSIINENAKERCGDALFYTLLLKGSGCEDTVKDAFALVWPTAEHALGVEKIPIGVCPALRRVGMNIAAYTQCLANTYITALKIAGGPLVKIALQQTPTGRLVLGLTEGGITMVKFIADPKSELESMANTAKAESVNSTQKVLEQITTTSSFDAGDEGFRSMWATFAGVGLVLMGLMIFALHHSYSRGEMSDDTYQNALMYYAPGGAILAIWGPPLIHQLGVWSSGLAAGTGAFAGSQVTDFIAVIARFGALESTDWFGPLIALLFFGLLLLGSWGVLIYLAMVPFLQASAALALALLVGMFIHPRTKPYALKIGATVLGLMFLKPVLYLLLGGIFWILAHQEVLTTAADNVLSTAVSLAVTAMVLIAVLFAPAAIFRLMPAMPSSDFQFGGGPNVAGAAMVAGAGAAVSRSISSKRGGAASSGRPGSGGSWGPRTGPTSSGDAGGGPGPGAAPSVSPRTPGPMPTPQPGRLAMAGGGSRTSNNSAGRTNSTPDPTGSQHQGTGGAPGDKTTPPRQQPNLPAGGNPSGGKAPVSSAGPVSGLGTTPVRGATPENASAGPQSGAATGPPNHVTSTPGSKIRSVGSTLGAAVGSVARASVTPIQAGAVGALHAGREGARRAREASDAMIPKSWGE